MQLILNSANITGTTVASGSGNGTSAAASSTAFGFFEWPLAQTSSVTTNAGVFANTTITSLDSVGFDLFSGLGGSSSGLQSGTSSIGAVAHHPSGIVFVGGIFSLSAGPAQGASNIALWKDGQLAKLAGSGLDAPVDAAALSDDGNTLFVGGTFTDTVDKSTGGKLVGIAAYDVQGNQWSSLAGGVNGAVESLDVTADNLLLVVGNFTATGDGGEANGLAAWNITSKAWVNPAGFLVGKMTFIGNSTSPSKGQFQSQILAGNVAASLKFGAAGFVTVQNGDNQGVPKITPLTIQLEAPSSISTLPAGNQSASVKRHHTHKRSSPVTGWIHSLFRRQTSGTATLAPLPPIAPTIAPAVLAGAYWTDPSTSRENAILGGNFTYFTSAGIESQNVAIYDIDAGIVNELHGNQINGTVRALFVQGEELYVGGGFTVEGTNFDGFALYDLARQQWDTTGFQPLSGSSGSSGGAVVVRSITASPSQSNTIIVGGSFAQGGNTPCRAICAYNTQSKQWSALGNGIQGEVASVAYAGVSSTPLPLLLPLTHLSPRAPETPSLRPARLPLRTVQVPT